MSPVSMNHSFSFLVVCIFYQLYLVNNRCSSLSTVSVLRARRVSIHGMRMGRKGRGGKGRQGKGLVSSSPPRSEWLGDSRILLSSGSGIKAAGAWS
jgi:hypothetical protein